MRFNLKALNKKYLISGSVLFLLFMGIIAGSFAFAVNKPCVVLFCADWNIRCREAKPALESVVASYDNKVDLREINIDSQTAPDAAISLGLSIPRAIPYIVIIDKNGNKIAERSYNRETPQQLKTALDPVILPQL